ncbi:MAG: hypothetical protein HDS10_03890 [Bacteroides sp.]|nr:hypothetical protein [Bacteroides sp.]
MKQTDQIADFIDSLGEDSMLKEEQSFLLSPEVNAMGAGPGDNGGSCVNAVTDNCSHKNGGDCSNSKGACNGADNKKACRNLPEEFMSC